MSPRRIHLTLPWPVSANRYWRSFVPRGHSRSVVTLSEEAKDYKREVAGIALAMGLRRPIEGRVEVRIALYPQRPLDWAKRVRRDPIAWDDDVRCIDLDNANKVLLDALKGVAFVDDKWVRRIVSERMEPDDAPMRVEVVVLSMARPVSPQAELLEQMQPLHPQVADA